MNRVLVTCFEPYDEFPINASQVAMQVAREIWNREYPSRPGALDVAWETLPVDFNAAPQHLTLCLDRNQFSHVLHTGQAPGAADVQLETQAVNERFGPHDADAAPLIDAIDAAPTYASDLPLADWAAAFANFGLAVSVSHDAGRYLCNAILYHSLHRLATLGEPLNATFLHVPMLPEQFASKGGGTGTPNSLPAEQSARVLCECLRLLERE